MCFSAKSGVCLYVFALSMSLQSLGQDIYIDRTYDYKHQWENGSAIVKDRDSGYYLVGETVNDQSDNSKIYVLKVSENGDTIWSSRYGISNSQYYDFSAIKSPNGIIITGTEDKSGYDGFALKINFNGDSLWYKTYSIGSNRERIINSISHSSGGFLLTGSVQYSTDNRIELLLLKIDSSGTQQWYETYGGYASGEKLLQKGWSVIEGRKRGYYILGTTDTTTKYQYMNDIYLLRLNNQRNVIWEKSWGKVKGNDIGMDMIHDAGDKYLLTGAKTIKGAADDLGWYFSQKSWISQIDSNGIMHWQHYYGDDTTERYFSRVSQLNNDNIIASGGYMDRNIQKDKGWIVKMNSIGNKIWSRIHYKAEPLNFNDYWYDMVIRNDKNPVIIGTTKDSTTYQDIWLLKLDSMGCDTPNCQVTGLDTKFGNNNPFLNVYPNPFSNFTIIQYHLNESSGVLLEIYNVHGQKVNTVVDKQQTIGTHKERISLSGSPPGLYFFRLRLGEQTTTRKLIYR